MGRADRPNVPRAANPESIAKKPDRRSGYDPYDHLIDGELDDAGSESVHDQKPDEPHSGGQSVQERGDWDAGDSAHKHHSS
jgi:hypothetical protein